MFIALVWRGGIVLLTTPHAVLLSVWIGVLGCLCPVSSNRCLINTASCALTYRAPSSASAALEITVPSIFSTLSTAPLFGGSSVSLVQ